MRYIDSFYRHILTRMSNIERIFIKYIKGTPKLAIVRDITITFCTVTNEVRRVCSFETVSVHITTKVIKKNYDKRTAQENDFILKHGWKIVHMPDYIYLNKNAKRGDYLFAKKLNNDTYVASIEIQSNEEGYFVYVVSMFRVAKERYLDSYSLIWSWKGGDPSS